jgi:hypothetical protein
MQRKKKYGTEVHSKYLVMHIALDSSDNTRS